MNSDFAICKLQFQIHPAAPLSVMDVCCDWSVHGIDCGVREIGSNTQCSLATKWTIFSKIVTGIGHTIDSQ